MQQQQQQQTQLVPFHNQVKIGQWTLKFTRAILERLYCQQLNQATNDTNNKSHAIANLVKHSYAMWKLVRTSLSSVYPPPDLLFSWPLVILFHCVLLYVALYYLNFWKIIEIIGCCALNFIDTQIRFSTCMGVCVYNNAHRERLKWPPNLVWNLRHFSSFSPICSTTLPSVFCNLCRALAIEYQMIMEMSVLYERNSNLNYIRINVLCTTYSTYLCMSVYTYTCINCKYAFDIVKLPDLIAVSVFCLVTTNWSIIYYVM